MDLKAAIDTPVVIGPGERILIPTGIYIELPEGYCGMVVPRSGLSIKHGITVLNSPGIIDPDYRGEIKVILVNLSNLPFKVFPMDRIAQLMIVPYARCQWEESLELSETERGDGGFGSTGIN